jgi:hypothetical protein
METTIKYQVKFTEETKHGKFTDALYYDKLPDEETIAKDAQVRVDNWLASVDAPPVEPTEEELIARYKQIEIDKLETIERADSASHSLEQIIAEKFVDRGVELKEPIDVVLGKIIDGVVDVKDLVEEVVDEKPIDEIPVEEKPTDVIIAEDGIPAVKG